MLIKTNYDGCPYITAGKEYKAYPQNGEWIGFHGFTADDGELAIISDVLKGCPRLDGHNWQIVQEGRFSQEAAQEMYDLLGRMLTELEDSDYTVFCDRGVGKWVRPAICDEADRLLAKARGEL